MTAASHDRIPILFVMGCNRMSGARKLNEKQRAFVEAYFNGAPEVRYNQTQSAITAGYSKRTAYSQGNALMKHPEVRREIDRRLEKHVMSKNEALEAMSEIAHSDIDDFMTMPGTFPYFDYDKARELGKTHLIKEIIVRGDGGIRVKLYDRQSAIETMFRHHGLLKDGALNINVNIVLVIEAVQALERAGVDVEEFFRKAKERAEQEQLNATNPE